MFYVSLPWLLRTRKISCPRWALGIIQFTASLRSSLLPGLVPFPRWFLMQCFWAVLSPACLTHFRDFSVLVFSALPAQLTETVGLTGSSFPCAWGLEIASQQEAGPAYFPICFPFLGAHSPVLPVAQCLKTACFIRLSSSALLIAVGKSEPSCSPALCVH